MHRDSRDPPLREDGLQLDEHRSFQIKFWWIQRIAWGLFGIVIVAAILGLTGSGGPLQKQRVTLAGVTLDFPRVSRWEAADEILVVFDDTVAAPSITISGPFFERFGIEQIQPEPISATLTPSGQTFTFDVAGVAERTVHVDIRARHFGLTRFDISAGSISRSVSLLIMP